MFVPAFFVLLMLVAVMAVVVMPAEQILARPPIPCPFPISGCGFSRSQHALHELRSQFGGLLAQLLVFR
jgi:hypothetical protein